MPIIWSNCCEFHLENLVGYKWINVRGRRDSENSSWNCSEHDFNYDSKFLVEVRGLPWSATKQDVSDFFKNVNILNGLNGIHFIVDEKNIRSGRAYIQIEQLRDYMLALKCHNNHMDDRFIEGTSQMQTEYQNRHFL